MKLTRTSHRGTCFILFESNRAGAIKQKIKLIKIPRYPKITNVPVTKGNGIKLSSISFLLLLNSRYPSKINTTKLILQIKVILENNFIDKAVYCFPFTVQRLRFSVYRFLFAKCGKLPQYIP